MTNLDEQRRRWLDTIRVEGDRLAAVPVELLAAPVPALPDWTVERVVRHVGRIHRWVTRVLAADADADTSLLARAAPSLPRGPACVDAYRAALDELLVAFEAADLSRPVASFTGPATVAFWLRRQAHEVAVHRVDATDAVAAAGGPTGTPLDSASAADGVAEWVEVFVAGRVGPGAEPPAGLVGRTVRLVVTDAPPDSPGEWTLHFDAPDTAGGPGRVRRDADVTLGGAGAAMLLMVWRRRGLDTVHLDGNRHVAEALLDAMRF